MSIRRNGDNMTNIEKLIAKGEELRKKTVYGKYKAVERNPDGLFIAHACNTDEIKDKMLELAFECLKDIADSSGFNSGADSQAALSALISIEKLAEQANENSEKT